MFCSPLSDDSDSVSIPTSALYQRDGNPAIWLVEPESGRLISLPVSIVRLTSKDVLVRGNLAPGQLLVSAGAYKLDEGQRVRIWERQE